MNPCGKCGSIVSVPRGEWVQCAKCGASMTGPSLTPAAAQASTLARVLQDISERTGDPVPTAAELAAAAAALDTAARHLTDLPYGSPGAIRAAQFARVARWLHTIAPSSR